MAKVKIFTTASGKSFSSEKEAHATLSRAVEMRMCLIKSARDKFYALEEKDRFNFLKNPIQPHGKGVKDWAKQIVEILEDMETLSSSVVDIVTNCEYYGQDGQTCGDYYNCCSCGDIGCGCAYCFDCKACDTCKKGD